MAERRKRCRLRLVYSAPPPEPLALVALERHQLVASWRPSARPGAAARQLEKVAALNARVSAARVADEDDARAALMLAYHDFNLRSAGANHDSPELQRAADLVRKVLEWMGAAAGDQPPPRLAG